MYLLSRARVKNPRTDIILKKVTRFHCNILISDKKEIALLYNIVVKSNRCIIIMMSWYHHHNISNTTILFCSNDIPLKGLPCCFFTRTSLPKSSNNLEPMCNNVNIKSSWLVIFRIISVTSSFTVRRTNNTNGNLKNVISNTLVFNDL